MRSYNLTGVVLKFTNFKDADKIYTIFTREKGKISVLAKGVRKISSKRGGVMDTLNHVSIGIAESPSGFKILTEAKNLSSFQNLKSSLDNSMRGFYLAELIYRLTEEEHINNKVFELLVTTLIKLDHHLNNEISRINAFEIALMQALGYEMYLDKCAKTNKPYRVDWEATKFSPSLGGLVCDSQTPGVVIGKNTAELLFSLKTKKTIHKSLLEDRTAVLEADRMIKLFIDEVMDEKLKSTRILH
ncbi:DNA repair protein RecO [candidate division WWE3 bacterium]|nr:DNA repair protein RecO [candidate division WWE3 bacterium]